MTPTDAGTICPSKGKGGDEVSRFRVNLAELLDRHDMRWREGPPADWKRGAPIGNGDFGAVMHGFPDALGFVIGKTDVWDRINDGRSWFVG